MKRSHVKPGKCIGCGNRTNDPRNKHCRACYLGPRYPTALREWCRVNDTSLKQLGDRVGVSERTMKRAAAGDPISRASAKKIAEETGLDVAALVMGLDFRGKVNAA